MEAGYRGIQVDSPLFIGTVAPEWNKLSAREQRAEGARMGERLRPLGVQEVLLYDPDRNLRFHSIGDQIRYPEEGA